MTDNNNAGNEALIFIAAIGVAGLFKRRGKELNLALKP
jgi:hypothetical protein